MADTTHSERAPALTYDEWEEEDRQRRIAAGLDPDDVTDLETLARIARIVLGGAP